ncbi:FecR family protein [Desulfuribacillus alkaliarsenatis]|uniref:FecR protein domain-containing protein n=1 Tax=Desulfuribacillus alkaliarsenatis TaxID=766136 RepID=A0A1E5G2S3_9FIRM|nr:FecR family protein [Desulfuribacillus alkaliarsenatis]OEF97358.1 hypothetical protein BHF68_03870 [Desulfuribacillus alkaliarsenatis]
MIKNKVVATLISFIIIMVVVAQPVLSTEASESEHGKVHIYFDENYNITGPITTNPEYIPLQHMLLLLDELIPLDKDFTINKENHFSNEQTAMYPNLSGEGRLVLKGVAQIPEGSNQPEISGTFFYTAEVNAELYSGGHKRHQITLEGDFIFDINPNNQRAILYIGPSITNNPAIETLYTSTTSGTGNFLQVHEETKENTRAYMVYFQYAVLAEEDEHITEIEEEMIEEESNELIKRDIGSIRQPRPDQFGPLAGQNILSGVQFDDLYGEVMVWDTDDWEDSFSAGLNAEIYVHSVIVTGPNSGARLSLRDGTIFVMGPNSMVTVSDESDENGRLGLLVGHVMINVRQMLRDGSMDIEMSVAAAGARGTIFVVEETENTSTLKVLEGTVEFKTIRNESFILESGQMITATEEATGSVVGFSIDEELKNWPTKTEEEIRATLIEKGINVEVQQDSEKGIPIVIITIPILAVAIAGYIFYTKK